MLDLRASVENRLDLIKELRQKFSGNAELSFNEYKTQKIIKDFFKKLDIRENSLANTGVVGTLNDGEECIAIRADMDALPVNGISHACGHDYHMAVALGVCQVLKDIGYNKCIKFIFQPGEEGDGGAVPMINEGVMDNPKITHMIGLHVWPEVKVGTIEVSPGASMASIDDFTVTFKGKGGHAAMPHKCLNPIYPAIEFINTVTAKSRIEHNPLNPHVLTVASINCGSVNNVIDDEAIVRGTVRTFSSELRESLHRDIVKSAHLSGEKYSCDVDVFYDSQYPPLLSDEDFTKKFIEVTRELIGDENVLPLIKTFAGEDFAYFAERVPSVHFRLGICDDVKGTYPLHSPNFNANEDVLFYGVYIIVNFILSIS